MTAKEPTHADARDDKGIRQRGARNRVEMPFFVPVTMLVICVVISVADLAFLNDVVGQVLDVDQRESIILSGVLGLVGLSFMAHLGYREANDHIAPLGPVGKFVSFTVWLLLGTAISLARFFSGKILDLGQEDGVTELFGLTVRQQDMVFAPIMFLMYVIAGLGALDATKSLLLNTSFHRLLDERAERRRRTAALKEEAKETQRDHIAKQKAAMAVKRQEAEKRAAEKRAKRQAEAERAAELKRQHDEEVRKQKLETIKVREALERENLRAQKDRAERRKAYHAQQQAYGRLRHGFREKSRRVTEQIALIEKLDAEIAALDSAYLNAVRIIDEAEHAVQHAAALKIHAKTQEPVAHLRSVIANFNAQRGSD